MLKMESFALEDVEAKSGLFRQRLTTLYQVSAAGVTFALPGELLDEAGRGELERIELDRYGHAEHILGQGESCIILGEGAAVFGCFMAACFRRANVYVAVSDARQRALLQTAIRANGFDHLIPVLCPTASRDAVPSSEPSEADESLQSLCDSFRLSEVKLLKIARNVVLTERAWPVDVRFESIIGELPERGCDFQAFWQHAHPHCHKMHLRVRVEDEQTALQWVAGDAKEVSVVLPVYNIEKYLEKCLSQLLEQCPDYFEIIAVNDGSTDSSPQILEQWAARHPQLRVIHKPNGGCASARSRGLAEAQGRYVGFVDPDDWTTADMFPRLHRAALLGRPEIVQCGYLNYYQQIDTECPVNERGFVDRCLGLVTDRGLIRELIALQPTIWRRIYDRKFLKTSGIDFETELRRFDDLPFQFKTFAAARSVRLMAEHMYYYRQQRPGQDIAISDERMFVHFDIFRILDDFVRRVGVDDLVDSLLRVKLATHQWALGKLDPPFRRRYAAQARRDLGLNSVRGTLRLYRLLRRGNAQQRRFARYLALGRYGAAARFAARQRKAAETRGGLFRGETASQA